MLGSMRRRYASRLAGPAPEASSAAVSRSMRSNKGSGTEPELTLARLLRKKLTRSKLPGSPDFVYPRAKLAVFVHGDWWHRNPALNLPLPKKHRAFWSRKFARNVERDRLVREELEATGWQVLVVWEHEVSEDAVAVARRIRSLASSGR
jgi:DNA mismatch endonuclease (patch repair protein)